MFTPIFSLNSRATISHSDENSPTSQHSGSSDDMKPSTMALSNFCVAQKDYNIPTSSSHRRKQTIKFLEDFGGTEIEEKDTFGNLLQVANEQIVTSEDTEFNDNFESCSEDGSIAEEKPASAEEEEGTFHSTPEPLLKTEDIKEEGEVLSDHCVKYHCPPEQQLEVETVAEEIKVPKNTYIDLNTMALMEEFEPHEPRSHFVRRSLRKRSLRVEELVEYSSEDDDLSPPRRKSKAKARRLRKLPKTSAGFEQLDTMTQPELHLQSPPQQKQVTPSPDLHLQSALEPFPVSQHQQQLPECLQPVGDKAQQSQPTRISDRMKVMILRLWEEFLILYVMREPKTLIRELDDRLAERVLGSYPRFERENGWLENLLGPDVLQQIFIHLDENKKSV